MAGRPSFSEDQIEEALRACGGIQSRAANALASATGISFTRQALNKAVKKSKRLQRACEEIVEETLDLAEDKCIEGIRKGDSSLIKFYLETRGKRRGYTRRAELTGTDAGPISVTSSLAGTLDLQAIRQRNIDLIDEVSKRLSNGAHSALNQSILCWSSRPRAKKGASNP
jgi:hypothetical protein